MNLSFRVDFDSFEEAQGFLAQLAASGGAAAVSAVPEAPKPGKKTKAKADPAPDASVIVLMPSITDATTTALAQPAPSQAQAAVQTVQATAATTPQLADVISTLTLVGQRKALGREALAGFMKKYSANASVGGIPADKYAAVIDEANKLLAANP